MSRTKIKREEQITEQLKDRRDYRNALIQRREDIENKIAKVEEQITSLKKKL